MSQLLSFLCLRRGVSIIVYFCPLFCPFSLPTQRCFRNGLWPRACWSLFSAYAEVFPRLCLREVGQCSFSLPTQRCFRDRVRWDTVFALFSAYAEVFRPDLPQAPDPQAFLCLRRGVSHRRHRLCRFIAFSLPTQRCFRIESDLFGAVYLFSAYAEVFL